MDTFIFVSTFNAMNVRHEVPSTPLSEMHQLHYFWTKHRKCLTLKGGLYNSVIHSLATIMIDDPYWKQRNTDQSDAEEIIRDLLSWTPPNIVVLDDLEGYSCHISHPDLWNFICLSNKFVQLWQNSGGCDPNLTTVLIASVHHALAHWVQMIKACWPDSTSSPSVSSSSVISPGDTKCTVKRVQAPWEPDNEDIGNFVEVSTTGGIMEYNEADTKAYIVVGPKKSDCHILPRSYLNRHTFGYGSPDDLKFTP